jgi:UDP-glucose 4-epimerase
MRILVTGGAGYIGSHAARLFLRRGHDVVVLDNLSRGHAAAAPAGRLIVGDLTNRPLLDGVLDRYDIEAVVHFAAFTYVGESVRKPSLYYHNNLVTTIDLLDAMRRCDVKRFVFSSTAAVYGTPERVPISEDAPLRPINPYGQAKLAVEAVLADYAVAYGLGYTALRYFNAAGACPDALLGEDHDPETHLIPIVLQAAQGRRSGIDVFGTDYPTADGTCVRDYIHVEDLADAHLRALESIEMGRGRAYNLGTGRGHSVREVIDTCQEVTGCAIPVRYGKRRAGDPATLVASAERARQELGWRPRYQNLRTIIETAWRWHESHPNGYDRVSNEPGPMSPMGYPFTPPELTEMTSGTNAVPF